MWAYLPVGPLERQLRKGNQGGFWEEVRIEPSRESCCLSLVGQIGEASASYLYRCTIQRKVARPNSGILGRSS